MVQKSITCNSPERLREKTASVCQRTSVKRRRLTDSYLRIRAGTFNVNGKLPAQDLSTWLGTSPNDKGPGGRVLCIDSHSDSLMQGQASTQEADMLVVAFQEVDLSTEAFFNFIGPAREDAWTVAILAALGDKAKRYKKVNFLLITTGTCS